MRWFKHLTRSHEDENLCKIIDRFGIEGYGIYWIILERIAGNMDGTETPSLEISIRNWSKSVGISPKKLQNFVRFSANLGCFVAIFSGHTLRIECPKLLKYKDEYARKSGHKQASCPDNIPKQSETETETDIDTEKKPPKSPLPGDLLPGIPEEPQKPKQKPKRKREPKLNVEPEYTPEFLRFWAAYPRKSAKGYAWECWQKIRPIPDSAVVDSMIQVIEKYKLTAQWQKGQDSIPHPSTWLNQRRWDDQPTEQSAPVEVANNTVFGAPDDWGTEAHALRKLAERGL